MEDKKQVCAPKTQKLDGKAFIDTNNTEIRWQGLNKDKKINQKGGLENGIHKIRK